MCEPAHSILQYTSNFRDDDDNPRSGSSYDPATVLESAVAKSKTWGKKILKWFHFSKVGHGHSEALAFTRQSNIILPQHTSYEGFWWNRTFRIDGPFNGDIYDREQAIECAEHYDQQTIFKNMKTFRHFLEESLNSTDRPQVYFEKFLESLNSKGRDELIDKFSKVFNLKQGSFRTYGIRELFNLRYGEKKPQISLKQLMY